MTFINSVIYSYSQVNFSPTHHSSIGKELNPFGDTQMMMSSIDIKDVL